jgi:sialate O-acetylesterase
MMNKWMVYSVTVLIVMLFSTIGCADGELRIAPCFGNHMVLQRGMQVPVWGTAAPQATITVSFAGQVKTVTARTNGQWKVLLDPMKANADGRCMVVDAQEGVVVGLTNVVVGDVWLCSGQSNMAMPVNRANHSAQEIAAADYPGIRLNREHHGWVPCSPESINGFSATAYYFGRDLHTAVNVPVGLIVRAVGGTPIEYWTPRADLLHVPYAKHAHEKYDDPKLLAEDAALKKRFDAEMTIWRKAQAAGKKDLKRPIRKRANFGRDFNPEEFALYSGDKPGNLFRRLIQPVAGYGIKGAVWYQGERNARDAENAQRYRQFLPVMIASWRKLWNQGDFPFLYVQLPNYKNEAWPYIRESMLHSLTVTNTGMAVTFDIGEENDIHPKNKQDVGKRLALCARQKFYGENIHGQSPLFSSMKIAGNTAILFFEHTGSGLIAKGGSLQGFTIAGQNREFVPATAQLKGNAVVVTSPDVSKPVAVRYGWGANPVCTLYSGEGLPASPFRTDNW